MNINKLLNGVYAARQYAEKKHEIFAESLFESCTILNEELGEAAHEIQRADLKKSVHEIEQIGAVCVRFLEHLSDVSQKRPEAANYEVVLRKVCESKVKIMDVWYSNLALLVVAVGNVNKHTYEYVREEEKIDKIYNSLYETISICVNVIGKYEKMINVSTRSGGMLVS